MLRKVKIAIELVADANRAPRNRRIRVGRQGAADGHISARLDHYPLRTKVLFRYTNTGQLRDIGWLESACRWCTCCQSVPMRGRCEQLWQLREVRYEKMKRGATSLRKPSVRNSFPRRILHRAQRERPHSAINRR